MALSGAASAAARPHKPEQRHRLRHAFEFMAAALLGDEQAGNLALHPRRYDDRAWLSQRLRSCRGVGCVPVNFASGIDHYWTCFDADARVERRLARVCVLSVRLSQRPLNGERCPSRAFGVVFLGDWITEQRHQPIA